MTSLIVASETSTPLSTDVPVPTDGQPEWSRCPECEVRFEPTLVDRDPASRVRHQACGRSPVPAGPFPFTVARWDEVECASWDCIWLGGDGRGCHHGTLTNTVGAIVELVEVVGPSHFPYLGMHHSRCSDEHLCHPDAAPDCFHTPTGTVTPIDPIPCERPVVRLANGTFPDSHPLWWADDNIRALISSGLE